MALPLPRMPGKHAAPIIAITTGDQALSASMGASIEVSERLSAALGRTVLVSVGVEGGATLAAGDLQGLLVLAEGALGQHEEPLSR